MPRLRSSVIASSFLALAALCLPSPLARAQGAPGSTEQGSPGAQGTPETPGSPETTGGPGSGPGSAPGAATDAILDAPPTERAIGDFLAAFAAASPIDDRVRARVDALIGAARVGDRERLRASIDDAELLRRAEVLSGVPYGDLEREALWRVSVEPLLVELEAALAAPTVAGGDDLRLQREAKTGTLYVVLRLRDAVDLRDRYVHFALDAGDARKVTDFLLDDAVLWASEQVGLARSARRAPEKAHVVLDRYADGLQGALAMHEEGRTEEALGALSDLREDAESLGLEVPVGYWFTVLEVSFSGGRRDIADYAALRLVGLRPSLALPRFYRGRIALDAGKWAAARAHLESYQHLVGLDAQALAMMGDAYEGEGRLEEARRCWRAALDENPDLTDALFSLGLRLEGDADEVALRFARTRRPLLHVEPLLNAWAARGACDAVFALAAARREQEPRDPNAYYYAATCALREGRFEEAQELATAGRALAQESERRAYDAVWVEAAWSRGDPLQAYRDAPDRAFAFDAIAEQLLFGGGDPAQLRELIELRRADDDQDVWIPYYEGQLFRAEGMHRDADDRLRIGYTHALETQDAERAAAYRLARAENAYEGGSGVQAYQQMPDEDVYRRLLQLALRANDDETLADLLTLRKERAPDDPHVGFWIAHTQILAGQEERGLERLVAKREEYERDPVLLPWLESDLVRGCLRVGRMEDARRFAEMSTARDGDPALEFLVHVAAGRVEAAENTFKRLRELGYDATWAYQDPDVGARLAEDEAFANFRTLWPPRPR